MPQHDEMTRWKPGTLVIAGELLEELGNWQAVMNHPGAVRACVEVDDFLSSMTADDKPGGKHALQKPQER